MNEDEAAVGAFHLPTHPNGLVDAVRNVSNKHKILFEKQIL